MVECDEREFDDEGGRDDVSYVCRVDSVYMSTCTSLCSTHHHLLPARLFVQASHAEL